MKRVRIEIKSEKEFIGDLMRIVEKIDRGEAESTDEMVLSFEIFYRSITPDRLNLINIIKQNEPEDLAEVIGISTESLIEELREFDNSKVNL